MGQVIRSHRRVLAVVLVVTIPRLLAEIAAPIVLGTAVGRVVGGESVPTLLWWVLILAGVYAVAIVSGRVVDRLDDGAQQLTTYDLRMQLVRNLLDPRRQQPVNPGTALSTFGTDIGWFGIVPVLFVYSVQNGLGLAVVAVVLFATAWQVGLAVVLGAPIAMLVAHAVSRRLGRHLAGHLEGEAAATRSAADLMGGLRILQGLGAEATALHRYRAVSSRSLTATLRLRGATGRAGAAAQAISGLFVGGVGVLAGWLALSGHLGVGQFVTVLILAQYVLGPVNALAAELPENLARVRAAGARLLDLVQAPRRADAPSAYAAPHGSPALELVGLEVGTRTLDLTVAPGELVGVLADGPTAQALEDVLALRRPAAAGTIRVLGLAVGAVDDQAVRDVLVVAPHRVDLFDGSILDNVQVQGASREDALRALSFAAADEFVAGLADGVDSRIGESGAFLSGGQRQRIALARALAARPPVLVLHEPTTALDSVTEAEVVDGLRTARAGLTTVLITTSAAMLAAVDRVVWVCDGAVVSGSHRELLVGSGYREAVA